MSSIDVVGPGTSTPTEHRSQTRARIHKTLVILAIVIAVVLFAAAVLSVKYWPFSEKAVQEDLAEAADSRVTIRGYHPTYFPHPGCILEGVEFRHGANQFRLITIPEVIIEGSYSGILTQHVPRITAAGAHIFIPPFGANTEFHSQHSALVVDELVANGTRVEFTSSEPQEHPTVFDVHEALLRSVRWGSPIQYRLKLHNPNPPGELAVEGSFGPWADGHPQDTPMSGTYTFDHADLGVYGGIAGILSSTGKFDGVFKHINVSGATDTPDFVVTSGGHQHRLTTQFDAYVDATRGDTFLNRVEARLGRTTLLAQGSIAGSEGRKGKVANLRFTSRRGRIEDILGLFVTADRSPMSGDMSLVARAELDGGDQPFLERVKVDGKFGIDDGSFKPETQKDVNALSAGARGDNKDDPETVLTDLKGTVDLSGGVAHFSDLDFGVPGAQARLHDTYNIVNHRINLHGEMKVDTKISKTSSGAKALLLKIMDPLFRKKKKGEIVPVHILGTYEKPQFGLDFGDNGKAK
jgi:AsmA-like C-terminal region